MTAICSCVFYIFMILLSTLIIVFRVFYSILQFRYHISFHWTKYWQRGLATESLQSVWSSLISWVVLTGPRNTQSWLSPFFCPTSAWVDTFTHRSVTFSTRMSDLSHVNFPVPFLLQKKECFEFMLRMKINIHLKSVAPVHQKLSLKEVDPIWFTNFVNVSGSRWSRRKPPDNSHSSMAVYLEHPSSQVLVLVRNFTQTLGLIIRWSLGHPTFSRKNMISIKSFAFDNGYSPFSLQVARPDT